MLGKHIVFRTDASLHIGTGHVMRCLTLADSLKAAGANCRFICRKHDGHLLDLILHRGHEAIGLPIADPNITTENKCKDVTHLQHSEWLGAHWQIDVAQTQVLLSRQTTDWLIVDHYALDAHWELALKPHYRKLLVIDDLADREHICDVLLDQNLVENMATRYQHKVPNQCICLIGPQYALLRSEFNALRQVSLARRHKPSLNRLLIFMGGSDAHDETGKVIAGIKLSKKEWQHIDVVVGQCYPALTALKESLVTLPSAVLHVQTPHMAELMASADLAVTAGGSVTWEKCVLGLPSLVSILGENQRLIATMMHKLGAQQTLDPALTTNPALYAKYLDAIQIKDLTAMSDCANAICDGTGIAKILKILESLT